MRSCASKPSTFARARSICKTYLPATVFILMAALAGAVAAGGQSFSETHAKISLIADGNSIAPGQTLWVGLLFDQEKGWHIYWENPGDSGEPPRIAWALPPGLHSGDIHWPVPVRLGTGTVIDYGYEGRVLLALPLTASANYKPTAPLTLVADVRYLICRDVCIPAKTHVTLAIPSASDLSGDAAARHALFQNARDRWPKSLPDGWKAQANDDGKHLVLSIETGGREAKARFFPLDEDQIDNAAPQTVTPTERGFRLTLKKSDQLLKPIPTLKGVVVLDPDRAFDIAAPVSARP